MMGEAPQKVWLIYPSDGSAPVLWTEPCPFPVGDEGEVVEYERTKPRSLGEAVKIARGHPEPPVPKQGFA